MGLFVGLVVVGLTLYLLARPIAGGLGSDERLQRVLDAVRAYLGLNSEMEAMVPEAVEVVARVVSETDPYRPAVLVVDLLVPPLDWDKLRGGVEPFESAVNDGLAAEGLASGSVRVRAVRARVPTMEASLPRPSRETLPDRPLAPTSRGQSLELPALQPPAVEGRDLPFVMLELHADGLAVSDLQAFNDTRVNGFPARRAQLRVGDVVDCGGQTFTVESLPTARVRSGSDGAVADLRPTLVVGRSTESAAMRRWTPSNDGDFADVACARRPGTRRGGPDGPPRITAPSRERMQMPVLGHDDGGAVSWKLGRPNAANLNALVLGDGGTGKPEVVASVLNQLPPEVRLFVVDTAGSYADLLGSDTDVLEPWGRPLPLNPLGMPTGAPARALDRSVSELRNVLIEACGDQQPLDAEQTARLERHLRRLVRRDEGLAELDRQLEPDLHAALSVTREARVFTGGPPLGSLLHARTILDLSPALGDRRTAGLVASLSLLALARHLATEPSATDACRFLVVVDDADVAQPRSVLQLVRQGRSRGLGIVACTSAPADLPVELVDEAGLIICLRLPGVAASSAAELLGGGAALAARIRGLGDGRALVCQGQESPQEVVVAAVDRQARP